MAKIPHPCYHQDQFQLDTDTSKVELKLSPSGNLSVDASGLRVDLGTLPTLQPGNHVFSRKHDFILTGAINTGILDIGGNGAVSTVQVGAAITNPYSRPLALEARTSMNGYMLPPEPMSAAVLACDMSWDGGTTWDRVVSHNLFSPAGSNTRAGFSTQQDVSRFTLGVGQTVTPRWVAVYGAVYEHVDLVQASIIKVDLFGHTV